MKREDFIEMETLISDLQLNFEYSFSESRPSVIKYSGIQTIESEGSLDNMGEEESGRDELMIHGNNDIAEFPHCYCGNIAVQKKDLIQAESSLSVEKLEKSNAISSNGQLCATRALNIKTIILIKQRQILKIKIIFLLREIAQRLLVIVANLEPEELFKMKVLTRVDPFFVVPNNKVNNVITFYGLMRLVVKRICLRCL